METTTPLVAAQLTDIYDSVPEENQVDADQFRTFILDGRHSRTFSTTYCWGCPIVVIAGQDRVLIAHIAEVAGDDGTFDTDDNYNEHAVQPITNLINANLESLGRNPAVMVFAKAASVRDAARWLHRGCLDSLINTIAVRLDISVNYITQDAYITQGALERGTGHYHRQGNGRLDSPWSEIKR